MINKFNEINETFKSRFSDSPIAERIAKADVKDVEDNDFDKPFEFDTSDDMDPIGKLELYYDDNDEVFRVGDNLIPDSDYEINGYTYETDGYGRISSVEGQLHLKERDDRLPIRDDIDAIGKGDQKEGDVRGHLIGDQFDGSNGLENMIPQDANVNMKDFKNLEMQLANEVRAGNDLRVRIEPQYKGDSMRPDSLIVTYTINGEESVRIFRN